MLCIAETAPAGNTSPIVSPLSRGIRGVSQSSSAEVCGIVLRQRNCVVQRDEAHSREETMGRNRAIAGIVFGVGISLASGAALAAMGYSGTGSAPGRANMGSSMQL